MAKTGPKPVARDKLDAAGETVIIDQISSGVSYRQLAAQYGVSMGTLCAWIEHNPERSHACTRARDVAAQSFEERAEEIIDSAEDQFALAKARELAIHLRWRAKAVNPKRYGDKQQIELNDVTPKSQDEVDKKLAAIMAKLNADKPDATANPEG